jgi:hypothetical protein
MVFRNCIIGLVFVSALGCGSESSYHPVSGDIIFHTSKSSQSKAIQEATHSPYSHMGIVYVRGGEAFVFEAIEPVGLTLLDDWIARGEREAFVVKRLRDSARVLTPEALARMFEVGEQFKGKHYDLFFEWSDDRIYCSELVWKVYKRATGVEIGRLESLKDFDRSSPAVRAKMTERWGNKPPLNEPVISPAAIFRSEELVEVYRCDAS